MSSEELLKAIEEINQLQAAVLNDYQNARGSNLDKLTALIETFPLAELTPEEEDELHDDLNDHLCDVANSFEANIFVNFNRSRQRLNVDVNDWVSSHC